MMPASYENYAEERQLVKLRAAAEAERDRGDLPRYDAVFADIAVASALLCEMERIRDSISNAKEAKRSLETRAQKQAAYIDGAVEAAYALSQRISAQLAAIEAQVGYLEVEAHWDEDGD
jgi:hypothetical protein